MDVDLDRFEHHSFVAAAGTFASYGALILAMFVLLFLVPFVLFYLL